MMDVLEALDQRRLSAGFHGLQRYTGSSSKRELQLGFDETGDAISRCSGGLLRDDVAGSAQLGGEILELWESIPYAQHGLSIVDVDAGGEGEGRDRRREHVHKSQSWMLGHEVPAAFLAVLTLAE